MHQIAQLFVFSLFCISLKAGYGEDDVMLDCPNGITNVTIDIPSVVECGLPVTATITADVSSIVYDSIVIDFNLPTGFEYMGRLQGAYSLAISPVTLRAPISNNEISFSFEVRGNCGVNDSDGVDFNFNYIINKSDNKLFLLIKERDIDISKLKSWGFQIFGCPVN